MGANAPGGTGATAHEISSKKFGANVRPVTRNVSVTTASGRVLDNNPRRVGWVLINRSNNDVSLDYATPVDSTSALILAALGGTISSSVDEDGETTGWELFGISPAGTVGIRVIEFITV